MYFYSVGPLADNYRKMNKNLFERVADGEETSHPPELTSKMMEIVR